VRPGDSILLAHVVDRPYPITPGIQLMSFVRDHCIVGPTAFPQLVHHVEKFFGAFVAVIVFDHLFKAEVTRGAGQIRGHDVPAHPAIGEVVQGAETPSVGEGVFIAGGNRDAERKVFGDRGQGGNDHQWIVSRSFHSPFHCGIGIAAKDVVETQHVAEEQHVEVGLVGNARQVRPVAQRVDCQAFVSRMRPEARRTSTAHTGLFVECKQQRFWIGHHGS